MRKILSILLLLAAWLAACSIEIQQSAQPASGPAQPSAYPMPTAEALRPESPSPTPAGEYIPVTWASLNLSGRLVFSDARQQSGGLWVSFVQSLDLTTGELTRLYTAPEGGFIFASQVSPDGSLAAIAYSPASGDASSQEGIYTFPLDGSQPPRLAVVPPTTADHYMQPEWSADGRYLYYTHVNDNAAAKLGQLYPRAEIFRLAYPDGVPELLAVQAFWPRLSPDGEHLAYITLDPNSGENKLYLAKPDGSQAAPVPVAGGSPPSVLDAPFFSPDGVTLLVSAPAVIRFAGPTWQERLLGIEVASAHSVPSEWFSIPIQGGEMRQLTELKVSGLYASQSPDGRHLVSYSGVGLFVFRPDGSEMFRLYEHLAGLSGTVNWIP